MSDEISIPDAEHVRAEFAYNVSLLADRKPPILYRWGGCEDPDVGFDCSGLVIFGLKQLTVPIDVGRPTADWFWQHYGAVPEGDELPGDLAFYGKEPVNVAHHVVVLLPGGKIASMSGGSPACRTDDYARATHAWMRVYDSPLYRPDLLGFRRVDFSKAKGVTA